MKRLCCLALLTLISSSAHAASFSFAVGGHRVHISSARHCLSASCASVSISGFSRHKRGQSDEPDRSVADTRRALPAATPAAQPLPAPPVPAAVAAPPPPTPVQPAVDVPPEPPPPPPPVQTMRPAPPPAAPSPVVRVSHEVEEEPANAPVGDWRTEGKGLVRIVRCGAALCGYRLDAATSQRGEAVLVNMKPKGDMEWVGNIFSHDSGDTYYGTMALRETGTLRVKACALLRFYCSGTSWVRVISGEPERLITSRQPLPEPRS